MRTLHWYLIRQLTGTLFMSVLVFSFMMLLVNVIKELLMLLVSGQATISVAIQAVLLLIPYTLVYSLPMGMLTATLLTFGRLSADQELTAMRASGVSLLSLITPVLVMAVLMSGVCAYINMSLAPRCRVQQKELLYKQGLAMIEGMSKSIPAGTYYDEIPNHLVYVSSTDEDGAMRNLLIFQFDDAGKELRKSRAEKGYILGETNGKLQLRLHGFTSADHSEEGVIPGLFLEELGYELPAPQRRVKSLKRKVTEMTFSQLRATNAFLQKKLSGPVVVPQMLAITNEAGLRTLVKSGKKTTIDPSLPIKHWMHHQVSYSFACIGFALVGIPLGIRAHRRETSIGVAIALGLVLVYYSFMILGEAWELHPQRLPEVITWFPNFLFQAVGGVLLYRANKGL